MTLPEDDFVSWHSEELHPRVTSVASKTAGYPLTITVDQPSYLRDGDLLAFPRTGDRAFVTAQDGANVTLDSRHVRYVDQRWVGYKDVWNGDEWIEVDIYEPLAIPHWYVRNLQTAPGDEVLNLGSTLREGEFES